MKNKELFEKYYYNKPDFIDGTTRFKSLIKKNCSHSKVVLELGPSDVPSNISLFLKEYFGVVIGLDVAEKAKGNPIFEEVLIYDGINFPLKDGSVDVIVSDYVNEHIELPEKHFSEVARVLKPGGCYIARVPQLLHYVPTLSRLFSNKIKAVISNWLRGHLIDREQVYPAYYRACTFWFYKSLTNIGLEIKHIEFVECEPSYAGKSKLLFFLFMIYERVVNASSLFKFFRANIFVVLEKT